MPRPKGLPKTGGRAPGTPNKATASVKEALSLAFDGVGGVPALKAWAMDHPGDFYKLWAKMLPTDVTLSDPNGAPLKVIFSHE